MAFEGLADKLQSVFKKLTARGKLGEADVKAALREVRMALLEADVNFLVVKDFLAKVQERAVGQEVMQALTPGQTVIKIVSEELTALMGGKGARLEFQSRPSVVLLCGLQGAGKTTLAAKLGGMLKKQGKNPMLAACDVYRPAAVAQLEIVGKSQNLPVFSMPGEKDAVKIAKEAQRQAIIGLNDVLIVDTAGRLQIDDALMGELEEIKKALRPDEILLVVDSMTGQEAVNVAKTFDERLDLSGIALTKLDGDTRGGAAISIRAVTGKPVKLASVGEKMGDIEPFYPDRMASRILGMGDVLSLIERAQQNIDEKKALELEQKLRKNQFTLDDFLDQMEQISNLGSMQELLAMLPGGAKLANAEIDEKQLGRTKALILSMTPSERRNPRILDFSRKKRVAAGSGTSVQQLNQLLKQFEQAQKMVKQFGSMGKKGKMRGFPKLPF
ncbi:MAG: signal recognition particle protein [Christensenellaceae bacterium]|nr:signal recognition particle protein [Christensenellaceae bacterium]